MFHGAKRRYASSREAATRNAKNQASRLRRAGTRCEILYGDGMIFILENHSKKFLYAYKYPQEKPL